jgi:hypothetical protein
MEELRDVPCMVAVCHTVPELSLQLVWCCCRRAAVSGPLRQKSSSRGLPSAARAREPFSVPRISVAFAWCWCPVIPGKAVWAPGRKVHQRGGMQSRRDSWALWGPWCCVALSLGPGLACAWWGLGQLGRPLHCSEPLASFLLRGVILRAWCHPRAKALYYQLSSPGCLA